MAVAGAIGLAACEEETPADPQVPEPHQEIPLPAPSQTEADDLRRYTFADLPDWAADDFSGALDAFRRSCRKLAALPAGEPIHKDARYGLAADWHAVCNDADGAFNEDGTVDTATARTFFETAFVPYEILADGPGTFTGYYEAELDGARTRHGSYTVPLYGVPDDLVTAKLGAFDPALDGKSVVGRVDGQALVPYADRKEIDQGYLADRNLEVIWVDDPVDAFILHIQGSGQVRLEDGTTVRVGYAGNNGHRFVGIGSLMLQRELIAPGKADMQSIRDWLQSHPEQAAELMAENPRYIFFRELTGDGPLGAQGVPLTPMRSLAVDTDHLPLGVPMWLDTTWPGAGAKPLRRLVVAQDVGSAIKGRIRGDFFWGAGEAALDQAGRMKQDGRYYVLIPRAAAARIEPQS